MNDVMAVERCKNNSAFDRMESRIKEMNLEFDDKVRMELSRIKEMNLEFDDKVRMELSRIKEMNLEFDDKVWVGC
jgi:hypothetical protein